MQAIQFLRLPDIGGEGNDVGLVIILQPAQDDGCVEPAGIGQYDFHFFRFFLHALLSYFKPISIIFSAI